MLVGVGCGGNPDVMDASAGDAATQDGGGRDTGTPDAGRDGGAGGQSMTFRAVQERFFGEPQPPEPNAELILVREDGSRERASADTNGEATFEVAPGEVVSVTAFTAGAEHKLASFVGFTREQLEALDGTHLVDDGIVLLPAGPRATRTSVFGRAAGATDSGTLRVAFGAGLSLGFMGPEWNASVHPGVPFTLVAHFHVPLDEPTSPRGFSRWIVGWDVVEHEPVTEDTEVGLSIDSDFPTSSANATVVEPSGTPFFDEAALDVAIMDADTGLFYGTASRVDIEPGSGRFSMSLQWVDIGATRTLTRLRLFGTGRESTYWADGIPIGDVGSVPFLSPVDPVLPGDGSPLVFSDGVEVSAEPDRAALPLVIYFPERGPDRGVSRAYYAPGATTLSAPPLPAELGAETFLGSRARGYLHLCEPVPGARCRRTTTGTGFEVVP